MLCVPKTCKLAVLYLFKAVRIRLLIRFFVALRTFEQGGVNLPARVSPEALLSRIVNGMRKKQTKIEGQ